MFEVIDDEGTIRTFSTYRDFREWWFNAPTSQTKVASIIDLNSRKRDAWLKTHQLAFPFSQQRQRRKAHK